MATSKNTALIAPAINEERKQQYEFINENEEFIGKSSGELKVCFVKDGGNYNGRTAELMNANHFLVVIFSAEFERLNDAPAIDIIHLWPKRGKNRILVERDETDYTAADPENITIYEPRYLYKSYAEIINFCKAKDDERSIYYSMFDNCHKFCIDFAKHCEIDYSDINFTDMEGTLYGIVNFVKFCAFCINNHHHRGYVYSIMFFVWSIFSAIWWCQIHSFKDSFKTQFDSCATGTFFILFASLITFCIIRGYPSLYKREMTDKNSNYFLSFWAFLYFLGGICYWFGGLAVTAAFLQRLMPVCHDLSLPHKGYCSAFAGVWFTECSLVGITAIMFAADIWTKALNFAAFRKFFNLSLLAFVSLVGFFCYAILATKMEHINVDQGRSSLGAVAAAYFFLFCISSGYIGWNVYKYYVVNEDRDFHWGKRIFVDVSCIVCTVFFGLILISGYFAIGSFQSQSIGKSALETTELHEHLLAVYWIGMAFFYVFYLFIILGDMAIGVPEHIDIQRQWQQRVEDNSD
eukprot:60834_1